MNFASITRRLRSLRWRPPRSRKHLFLGERGERAAARYLKRRRNRLLVRNYHCSAGEIDLIVTDGDTIVFVEVKTRSDDEHADPWEAAGATKWGRVERAARHFLARYSAQDRPCRFDLVTVVWPPRGPAMIEHFEDAYQPCRA